MSSKRKVKLPVEKLLVGLMVDLELSWTQHPFLFRKFRIKSQKDIAIIKTLDLREVTVFPDESDIQVKAEPEVQEEEIESNDSELDEQWKEKNKKLEDAEKYRKQRQAVTKRYKEKATMVRKLVSELKSAPANAIHNAAELVENLVVDFEGDGEVLTNIVNLGAGDHTLYNHTMNVTILSLSLASVKGIEGERLRLLARGALLHDVGKIEIPGPILNKKTPLTSAEKGVFERHPVIGHRLCELVADTPKPILEIIDGHHEFLDGSGYPKKLKGDEISELTRIVAVANMYDNLCNPANAKKAMTPKIALATLYTRYKEKLDHDLVQGFISTLGVYPPGSVVKLSDESIGLVVAVDSKDLMNPEVLLYNPDIPRLQALIINLSEHPELKITDVLKPGEYPNRVYEYLGLEERFGIMTGGKA